MKILRASAILFSLTLTLMAQIAIAWAEGDEFYPNEEATERSTIVWPRLVQLHTNSAVLEWPGEPPHTLPVGERYRDYELLAVIPQPTPLAVLERSLPRWGVLAYVGTKGPVASMRKAVGSLDSIRPLTAFPPDYFERILNAQEDILGKEATSKGDEPSYESLAGLLPPLLGYTFLGTTTSSQKIIVWPDGRLGYGVGRDRKMSKVVFDPTEALHILNSRSSATKQGLIGRYLPVIDYGFSIPRPTKGGRRWRWPAVLRNFRPTFVFARMTESELTGGCQNNSRWKTEQTSTARCSPNRRNGSGFLRMECNWRCRKPA